METVCASSGFVGYMGVSCAAIITKNAMMEEPYRLSHMTSHTATLRHLRCPMIGEVTREM